MTPASVLVYPLLDPDAVLAARDTLEEAFAQGESGGDVELEISEISGCIRFTDRSRIWKNEGEPPPDGPSAERAARSFIEQTERLTARAQLPRVFPADLHSLDASPVYTPEGERPDHWL